MKESDMILQAWPFNRLTLTNNHKNLIEMIKYLVLWIRVKHLNSISKAETVCRKFILDIRSRDVHSKSRFNHFSAISLYLAGNHGPLGLGTDRSELVRDLFRIRPALVRGSLIVRVSHGRSVIFSDSDIIAEIGHF